MHRKTVSVVTPLFNESENLSALARRLDAVFRASPDFEWEWIAVDDGSTDRTAEKALDLMRGFQKYHLIQLSRNFGQQAAIRAGLDSSQSDAVVFLDADLQDPPEVIPELIAQWQNGSQVVFAARRSRVDGPLKRLLTAVFHKFFHLVSGGLMPSDSGNFGLCDRSVAEVLKRLPEHDAYLPALRAWTGFPSTTIEYDRASRLAGKGLSLLKLIGFAWSAVTAFTDLPLRVIFVTGLTISFASFTYGSVLVLQRILQFFGFFKDLEVLGFTTIAVAVFFMGGVQLLSLGIIGEYVARVYREAKNRPHYLVASRHQSPAATEANGGNNHSLS